MFKDLLDGILDLVGKVILLVLLLLFFLVGPGRCAELGAGEWVRMDKYEQQAVKAGIIPKDVEVYILLGHLMMPLRLTAINHSHYM